MSPLQTLEAANTHTYENRHRTQKEKPQAHFPKAVFFIILVHSASYQIFFYILFLYIFNY